MLLELGRFGAAGPYVSDAGTEDAGHLGARGLGPGRVSPRVFLDDPFQHAPDEGHAGCLDRLQVDRRQQPGPVVAPRRGGGEAFPEIGNALAGRGADRRRRVRFLDQVAHRRPAGGHVDHAIRVQAHHAGPRDIGSPDAPDKCPAPEVLREYLVGGEERHQIPVPRRFSSYCW